MIELEDNVGDIVGKAQRGLGISDSELAKKSGVNADAIRNARDGQADEATLRAVAPVLNLDANALVDLAQGKWKPDALENFEGLAQFNTSYSGMLVNAYLVWDPATKHAAALDTGGDSPGGMAFVVHGLGQPIAIVGDWLFAGSMGGGSVSYKDAVQNNLEKILTLPDETIICPGHGPMTSLGEEKKHNPFFVGKV